MERYEGNKDESLYFQQDTLMKLKKNNLHNISGDNCPSYFLSST